MTARQRAVLATLRSVEHRGKWTTPMDVGGTDQSHHARTLMQLVRLGAAESKKSHSLSCPFGMVHEGKKTTRCTCKGSRKYKAK